MASGEVGKVGVAIDSLADIETLFNGIPLDKVSTSMTINATASYHLSCYIAVGEKQGVSGRSKATESPVVPWSSRYLYLLFDSSAVAKPAY